MALSDELEKALEVASIKLSDNAHSELILPYRWRIWSALGPRLVQDNRSVDGLGLRRRTMLSIFCTRHVSSIWEKTWPNDDSAEQMLKITEQYLQKRIDFDSAWEAMNNFWGTLDNFLTEDKYRLAAYVGYAAANAVSTALYDMDFDPNNRREDFTDFDLDMYDWDSSFYASLAYAGGATWEENTSSARRREFWQWYIKEAVPIAWDSAP